MIKKVFLFFIPAILMAFAACVLTEKEDTSHVIIYAGNSSLGFRVSSISDVNYLKLTVTADDIDTISRVFTGPEISLDIASGPARTFKLEAFDSADSLLFYGSSRADLYPGETVTLKITMQEALYKIIFDKQGGSGGSDSVMAEYDVPMPQATAPVRTGYVFSGYFDMPSGGNQYYLPDMTSAKNWDKRQDTVLYAQWYPLYTFTTAGATGRQGPNQTQIDAAYAGTNLESNVTVTATGIQSWTVPYTGTYRIIAYGASGANAENTGYGLGARIQGDFSLNAGDTLWILVGQKGGGDYQAYAHIGGGGGSFVSKGTNLATSTLLLVAGGGGAAGANANADTNGQASEAGGAGYHDSNDGTNTANNAGGTAGAAGGTGDQLGMDSAAGINKTSTTDPNEAKNFFDGGLGSLVVSGTYNGDGGFGGGGAKISNTGGYATAGGGGGYSGGGASDGTNGMPFYGGGGGSYNSGTNPVNTSGGAPQGDGKVEIIYLGP